MKIYLSNSAKKEADDEEEAAEPTVNKEKKSSIKPDKADLKAKKKGGKEKPPKKEEETEEAVDETVEKKKVKAKKVEKDKMQDKVERQVRIEARPISFTISDGSTLKILPTITIMKEKGMLLKLNGAQARMLLEMMAQNKHAEITINSGALEVIPTKTDTGEMIITLLYNRSKFGDFNKGDIASLTAAIL